ncbi:MAG: hypothetical protein KGL95_12845, partial [Patescibacteria group bacterium]|nr:hypothetical protein [Patescibacteria group bacterium]
LWNWGDGQSIYGDFPQSHTYANAGTYTIKVVSCDNYKYCRWESYTTTVQSPPPPVQETISVTTDKTSYNSGDTITISGSVSSVIPNQMVTLELVNPSGQESEIGQSGIVLDDMFNFMLTTNANMPAGTYTLMAVYGGVTSQTEFYYSGTTPSPTPAAYTISVQSDQTLYDPGKTATISVYPYNAQLGQDVAIIITDPSSNIIASQTVSINAQGRGVLQIELPSDAKAGAYQVTASMSSNGNYQQGSATFTVSSQIYTPPPTPSVTTTGPSTIPVDSTNFSIQYTITNGRVLDIKALPAAKSLTASIQTTGDGLLTITMSRALIDATNSDGTNTKFIVLNDGQENTQANEVVTSSTDRTLVIPFKSGTQQLEIIGTEILTISSQPTPQSSPFTQQSTTNPAQTTQQISTPPDDSVNTSSLDGLLHVSINYQFNEDSSGNRSVHWYIFFEDSNGQQIPHSNYAISVMQDGNQLLDQTADYAITGGAGDQISNLSSFDPLGFKITYLGIGLQYADPSSWTGPKGDIFNLEIPKVASNNPSVGSVSVTLDKKSYNKGDLIVVSGTVSDSTSGDSVNLELVDPSGGTTELQSAKIQDDKTYSLLFTADDSIWKGAGMYTLKAAYGNNLPA